jgi:hypothetical protein
MELNLNPNDLKDENLEETDKPGATPRIHLHDIKFTHFKPNVQQIIQLVGGATYYNWHGAHQRVSPPKS